MTTTSAGTAQYTVQRAGRYWAVMNTHSLLGRNGVQDHAWNTEEQARGAADWLNGITPDPTTPVHISDLRAGDALWGSDSGSAKQRAASRKKRTIASIDYEDGVYRVVFTDGGRMDYSDGTGYASASINTLFLRVDA